MPKKNNQVVYPDVEPAEHIEPFELPLPIPINLPMPNAHILDMEERDPYSIAITAFRDMLAELVKGAEPRLAPNKLGKLATGLVRGELSYKGLPPFPYPPNEASNRHMHRQVIEDDQVVGIYFEDPDSMYRNWRKIEEHGVGPKLQGAIRTLFDNRDKIPEILRKVREKRGIPSTS